MTSPIEIEIDGQTHAAEAGQMIIEVADKAGVYIPRFCYHKHLSIAANCRMCLVDVEKSPKALPACATPVMPNMKVWTKSAKTIAAQRAVMEFLLINHPLDCPICDQGGECELQDLAMGYGGCHSAYEAPKRAVSNEDLGPLVATEMTRCILCTRCVRFGSEIAGMRELGVVNRGGHAEISTYVAATVQSPLSGNIIDLCPVGALTSKPFQFKARAWELKQAFSIAPHDAVGSSINVHTHHGDVLRVVAHENQAVNEVWLSDRDRFSYTALQHEDRLAFPSIRLHGVLEQATWDKALLAASEGLRAVIDTYGAASVGVLASESATLEELYLLQKIARHLGIPHIDHRLRECDIRDQMTRPLFPAFETTFKALEEAPAIFLIGAHLSHEAPVLSVRLRKAIQKGGIVCALHAVSVEEHLTVKEQLIAAPHTWVTQLSALLQALKSNTAHPLADALRQKPGTAIILGASLLHHKEAALLRSLAKQIAACLQGTVNHLTDGANSAGAWIAGMVPHRKAQGAAAEKIGENAHEMLKQGKQAYVLFNVEPEDVASSADMIAALKSARFVVSFSTYRHPVLMQQAHVVLPVAPFTETAGTFVNALGMWQTFRGVAKSFAESRPGWKALRVLGQFLHLAGFEYETPDEISAELKAISPEVTAAVSFEGMPLHHAPETVSRLGEVPLYSVDPLVRRAAPLQAMQKKMMGETVFLRLHPETGARLGLKAGAMARVKQGDAFASFPVLLDERVAKDTAYLPGALSETSMLSDLMGEVEVTHA